jgi:hypothetical protein
MQVPVTGRRTYRVPKKTICLWYDGTALEVAKFYGGDCPPLGFVRSVGDIDDCKVMSMRR